MIFVYSGGQLLYDNPWRFITANFTTNDELEMKAKINFASQKGTRHPNVLEFVGACVDNPECE